MKTLSVRGSVDALLKALNQKSVEIAVKKPEIVTQPVKSVTPSPAVEKKVQPVVSEKSAPPASKSDEKEEKVVASVTSSEK